MTLFGAQKQPFSFEVVREGEEIVLMIDLESYAHAPSLEDDPICMSKTIEIIAQVGSITKIVYAQKRNYEYDYGQSSMLMEISSIYSQLTKRKDLIGYGSIMVDPKCSRWSGQWYSDIQNLISSTLKKDPLGAYVELKRKLRDQKVYSARSVDNSYISCSQKYSSVLSFILTVLEKTKMVSQLKHLLVGYKIGDRSLYRRIFTPDIRPDFMFTKLMASFPDGEEVDNYKIGKDTEVRIFNLPNTVQYLYHLTPPEFKLTEEKYEILDTARKIVAEHKPTKTEFVEPERMRQVFFNVGMDLIEELATYRKINLDQSDAEELAEILVRYTVGFGLIEVLLQDEKIQDITVNSPMGETPIFIVHSDYTDCKTNIIPTTPEAESWA